MRRNVEKPRAFLQAILSNNWQLRRVPPHKKAAQGPLAPGRQQNQRPSLNYFQPFCAISCTAARFLAPICSAEMPSALKLPKRLRMGLLP